MMPRRGAWLSHGAVTMAGLLAVGAAGCRADQTAIGESNEALCTDQGGGPGAVVRTNGKCRQVELLPVHAFQHDQAFDAHVALPLSLRFRIPSEFPVMLGNAGNHDAHLTFGSNASSTVDCLYRGGSSQAHPTSVGEIQKGRKYLFMSCSDASRSGDTRAATSFTLHIDGDDRDPARAAIAELVLDEADVCGIQDAGVDITDADSPSEDVVDAADAFEADAADVEAGEAEADHEASSDVDAAVRCGDGVRDPVLEECDLGADVTSRALCTSDCRVRDLLAVVGPTIDAAHQPGRTLGEGRHPIAVTSTGSFGAVFVEPDHEPLRLSLTTYTSHGVASDVTVPISGGSVPLLTSHPVVAALPNGNYAAVYTDFDGDGDELGVVLRLVDPTQPPSGSPAHANTTTAFSQYDADIVATASGLVVAWVDDSNAETAPDVKFRTFGFDLTPTSTEMPLVAAAGSGAREGDVVLSAFEHAWAAAWRAGKDELETIEVQAGTAHWTAGPFLPGPVGSKPALAELDPSHLLVVYVEGMDRAETGVANGSKLRAAVLDLAAPATAIALDIPATLAGSEALSQDQPNVIRAGDRVFVAWRTEAAVASPQKEDLWLKEIVWNGEQLDLGSAEVRLPRDEAHRTGDQRHAALASGPLLAGGVQLVTAFDDFGEVFGNTEGTGDVVVEAIPVPVLRRP